MGSQLKFTTYSPGYKREFSWVDKSELGNKYAFSTHCCKDFRIDSMGRAALVSHMKSKKHIDHERDHTKSLKMDFFLKQDNYLNNPTNSASTAAISNESASHAPWPRQADLPKDNADLPKVTANTNSMKTFIQSQAVTKAEIIWCLAAVSKHFSFRGAGYAVSVFPLMFEDSHIAPKMQLQKDKISYTIVHSIAPYFRQKLNDIIKDSEHIVVGFDESLNKISQKQQMDVVVRYWNSEKEETATRYFSSVFLERYFSSVFLTKAIDLKEGLKEAVGVDNLSKIIQVSMDGPAVNFSMLKQLKKELTEQNPNKCVLVEIGSCGLHNVHGAFKAGIKALTWEIDVFLRTLYYLFRDAPARRGHYIKIINSDTFPLKFCSIRWVENEKVARRAYTMLPFLIIWVDAVEKEGKKNPLNKNNNFQTIFKFVKDKLLGAKLAFFISAASLVEPFLTKFQTDAPMAPFLYEDIRYLMLNVMERFVKKEILNSNSSIMAVDLKSNENLIRPAEIDLGFETKTALATIKPKLADEKITNFRKDCRNFYHSVINKLNERSPLLYSMTRFISCINPTVIAENPLVAEKRLVECLDVLCTKNMWITGSTADKIKCEYKDVCKLTAVIEEMKVYKREEVRLDHFWVKIIAKTPHKNANLLEFLKFIFIMSHGNAALERGFSVNSDCIIENQGHESLTALRVTYDAIEAAGGVQFVEITKGMIQAAKNAHGKYIDYTKNKKKQDEQIESQKKKKRMAEEIRQLNIKKQKILQDAAEKAAEIEEKIKSLPKK